MGLPLGVETTVRIKSKAPDCWIIQAQWYWGVQAQWYWGVGSLQLKNDVL